MISTTSLVDGATLRAVTRVLGKTMSHSADSMDGDISAFENFLTAFLFSDKVAFIQTIPNERAIDQIFGAGDRPSFACPLIPGDCADIEAACKEIISHDLLRISKDGPSEGSITKFLHMIDRTVSSNWDNKSGSYKIYGEILGLSEKSVKTGPLVRMIFDCVGRVSELDAVGAVIDGASFPPTGYKYHPLWDDLGFTEEFNKVVLSLNWLLYRTMYYSLTAKKYNASLSLHPIRSLFSASNTLARMGVPEATCDYVAKLISREGIAVAREIHANIEPSVAVIEVPFFSAWIASRTKSPKDFIQELLAMREQKHFVQARGIFRNLQDTENRLNVRDSLTKHNIFVGEIQKCLGEIKIKYGLVTPQGIPTGWLVNITNFVAATAGHPLSIPDLGITLPGRWRGVFAGSWNNPYKQILRSAVDDLSTIPRLGDLHAKITSGMKFDTKTRRKNRG